MSEASAAPEPPTPPSPFGRAFTWAFLLCVAVPTLGGLTWRLGAENLAIAFLLLCLLVYLGCFGVGVGMLFRKQWERGMAVIVGALAGATVGFGTCALVIDSV